MGTPKPINLLDAPVRALQLTDLFPVRDPIALNGPAHKYTIQDVVNLISVALVNSGLWNNAGEDQLGQTAGDVTNPAKLLKDSEIPLNNFLLLFSQIGQTLGKHLQFKYDPAAAAIFEPFFEWMDSTGATIAALRIDSTGAIYFGSNNGTTATGRQNFSFGPNAMDRVTTLRDSIAIGAQAASGAGAVTPAEKIIVIGADAADMGIGFDIGSYCIIIGANSGDAGAFNIGAQNLWIGHFINNGATVLAGDTGIQNILIGNTIGTGGGAANLTILGHAITSLLSNLALIGRFDQNLVFGAALAGETDNGAKGQFRGNVSTQGRRKAHRGIVASDNFTKNDENLLVDSTAGNIVVTIDPTIDGIEGTIKKTSGDANTITITPASGTIQELGAPAANFVFNSQGEAITFFSDGTNLYVK